MSNFNWGVDGLGRAHICKDEHVVILCMLPGVSGQIGAWMLEEQLVKGLL